MTRSQQLPAAVAAARRQRYGDRALTRFLRLPPTRNGYTIRRGVKVPMRDGEDLLADHYAPDTDSPAGTILMRSPYGRGVLSSLLFGQLYAARGYHIVVQSVRGTFGSGGTLSPMTTEKDDGTDTVLWLREQPWYDGGLAILGVSYGAMAGWALLEDSPADLAAVIAIVGPHDASRISWETGAFALADTLGWSHQVVHQEEVSRWQKVRGLRRSSGNALDAALDSFPLGDAATGLLGDRAPWYEIWLEHPDQFDPYWAPMRFEAALDHVDAPVLLITGWQDAFLSQTLTQHHRLQERGAKVALTVGPWSHLSMLTTAFGDVTRETLAWLDAHVAKRPVPRRSPVRAAIVNDGWVDLPVWPPAADVQDWFLHPGGTLCEVEPNPTGPVSTFRFDPSDPTLVQGGPFLSAAGGYQDDSGLALRNDVLTFASDPLGADLLVVGTPTVDLAHSADNPHADVFVRISEVDSRGRSRNVTEGYRRLEATSDPTCVHVALDAVAYRFRAGSRIRVVVAGGAHPRFSRNTGSDESPWAAKQLRAVTHEVHHGAGGTSRLRLPIISDPPAY